MKFNRRLAALLLLLGFAAFLCLSPVYMIHEAGHDCSHHDCPICENMARMAALLGSFALLGILSAAILPGAEVSLIRNAFPGRRDAAAFTPVDEKVRLNN